MIFCATDEADYFAIASALAKEPDRLAEIRAKLQCDRLTAPLFDIAAYTRALEDLYETMWRRRRIGAACTTIWAAREPAC